ncbi:hypothetical protein RRG08_067016 [Elysia crispata]|uniref:Uncharacterized protein n=1 Tax=Elysia crispata TaxID=231223 RepID=A0AAE1DBH4_9GAST|nr:hypothetical protein RRG08_067016 [Elysia crispata]
MRISKIKEGLCIYKGKTEYVYIYKGKTECVYIYKGKTEYVYIYKEVLAQLNWFHQSGWRKNHPRRFWSWFGLGSEKAVQGAKFFQRVGVAGRTAHRDSHSSEERWRDCGNLERDAETGVNEKPAPFFRLCSDDFPPPTLKRT